MAEHLLELPTATEPPSHASHPSDSGTRWSPERLCAYIAWARRTLAPEVTPAAQAILQAYFQHQRTAAAMSSGRDGQERVTIRLLEAMVRLSQAHARLLGKAAVTAQDATAVVLLMDGCAHVVRVLSQVTGGGGGGGWGMCRSNMSDSELARAQQSLLERLDLAEVKPEGYENKPMPPGPTYAPGQHAAVVASAQAKGAGTPDQSTPPQGCSTNLGPSEHVNPPRGILARKMDGLAGERSSAPAVGGSAMSAMSSGPAFVRAPRGLSVPATEPPTLCNGASAVPVLRAVSAPGGHAGSAGPAQHAPQCGACLLYTSPSPRD